MSKILVSEDSIIVNQHICKTLEVAGYSVYSAFTGREAVVKANGVNPDLILMDIMMETQDDGIQAALQIKKESDVPIIFLTALTDDGTLERVKNSEPHGYIVKPFNEIELLSNIKVAIHKARAETEVKNNRDLFQASINSIDQVFLLIDDDGRVFYLNRTGEHLINKKFKDTLGNEVEKTVLLHDSSGKQVGLSDFTTLTLKSELFLKTKDREIPVGDFLVREVELKIGNYLLMTFKDISDRIKARNLQTELEQRKITSLIEGQENERSRLSREIHDGVGQMINLLKLNIKALPESDQKIKLEPIIEQTLSEVRNVTENLYPSRLNDFSLEKNIETLLNQFQDISTTRFDFRSSDLPKVNTFHKTHLYRIVQEAISNILKHSKASVASIQLAGLQDHIQLTIEDDGVGYDPLLLMDLSANHGLQNIEYRVNSMNGKFTVDSKKETGTMLLITIPLPNGN